ncbi:hypothetical protein GNI_112500 [Gregarina niphandrodes]|uniref:Uncharacterized protein n=1 Tax=Gregarina niphandrodes TaxID=110365 RepID=A0A023B3F4_GRENI|nr:hypothetical protein GNI_112500 [Gregarina niphandrodes]EZG55464.1 hypothetical protein GNI_112500 [Gregarina niphandrodes]|eukprot:XP_011131545.1 hypothetical protein GNI_112500 [Gregarina niphandrodes]
MEIATGGVDGVTRWGLEKDGRELSVLETYAGYSHFQWSHSGRFLVLWNERQFRLLDGRGHRGALMPVFEATSDAAVASVQFSASDSYFLLLSEQTVQVFKTNRMVAVRGTPVLARKVGVKEELVPASFVGDCGLVHVTPSLQLSYTNLPTPPEDPAQEQDSATEEQATEEQATEEHAAKKVATAPELAAKELTSQVLSESGERVSSLAVYSAPNPRIAYFCEGNPSYISVIELKEAADAGAAANAGAAADTDIGTLKMVCGLVSKTPIGRATEVEMSWNRSGCFLLRQAVWCCGRNGQELLRHE